MPIGIRLDGCIPCFGRLQVSVNYIVNSLFESCTYILPIDSGNDCYLVDCGDMDKIIVQGWRVRGVLLTHSHFDHIYGLKVLIEEFPDVIVYTNQAGKEGLVSDKWNFSRYHNGVENFIFPKMESVKILKEGMQTLDGGLKVNVIYTPGHDPSCISYIIDEHLFTGDAYIPGLKTVTSFPRSNKKQAIESLVRLQQLERNYQYTICAGHAKSKTPITY